jgi:hypothetical protein
LTPSWILSIRQFLANHNMSITVTDLHIDKPKGPRDEYIMQAEHLKRYSSSQQRDINLVRIWLQVTTLADLTDLERPNRISTSYLDAQRPVSSAQSITWPRQHQPTKAQTRLWKRYVTSSFLRYIPYWKTPPLQKQLEIPNAVPVSSPTLSTYHEYIAECLSRTERRLLDGLEQVASDLKIWRAFRAKSRLHLASDGGLGDTVATHGWILSTGKEVLFQCSGPVDGPIDTNSSTRSELGGCSVLVIVPYLSLRLLGTSTPLLFPLVHGQHICHKPVSQIQWTGRSFKSDATRRRSHIHYCILSTKTSTTFQTPLGPFPSRYDYCIRSATALSTP